LSCDYRKYKNSIVSTSPASPSLPSTTHTPAPTPAPSANSISPQSITAPLSASPLLPMASDISMHSDFDSHGFIPDNLQVVLSIPPLNLHSMQTRSKSGIIKRKALLATIQVSAATDMHLVEQTNYKAVLKNPVCLQAMKEAVHALHTQGTWSLVLLLANKNLVGCKWIFKVKRHSDGFIARNKTRLVARGFNQEPGLDYGEPFSPVVKPTTVRLVLALAAHFNWSL